MVVLAWQLLGIRHEIAVDLHDLQAQVFKARAARFNFFVVQQIRDAELHRKLEERLHQRSRFHIDQDVRITDEQPHPMTPAGVLCGSASSGCPA
ncbi:MAG TPA: hypothetical protein PKH75_14735, partial [Bacillota bacterium]|nr:hypothetical protein [Bacillota bacterium]